MFKPTTCKARQKVAVIIPYRDRWRNLMDFLSNVPPMLIRQQIEFTIYVIEQDSPAIFNRGLLMNIGYLEALKIDNYTCFIFHDVDLFKLLQNAVKRMPYDGLNSIVYTVNKMQKLKIYTHIHISVDRQKIEQVGTYLLIVLELYICGRVDVAYV
ncbi:beta-N-acetyl-D-glucosaminide beta-1,4-N-acetylglucosaminyl-transferase-like [Patella vulgata]|uniref:beta-N-acetyl-D-glucosaminide beta-1,4-N-acetylglucosaminyl-transferase-like n=1 Tax=Patella vulgata TaxID=6465 RepID=UPI00217F61A6|nr:beta-N-acetyl-D-glucosaminide beta-1,4-N-acetylglucosaminyl-transferase-like [Patella vulgata]